MVKHKSMILKQKERVKKSRKSEIESLDKLIKWKRLLARLTKKKQEGFQGVQERSNYYGAHL